MSVLICKMCGGDLEIREGVTTVRCPYCGTNQTLPKLNDEHRIRLFDRAGHFRRNNDYDKAMAMYEQVLSEDQTDSEAYWSIVLCRYGIEYVEDPATHKRIPTVNRMQYTSILADEDYKAALRYADSVQAKLYEQEAAVIDRIQKAILQVSQREPPYDVFVCYKEVDENGMRTQDSVLADEVYYCLTREGLRVFLARITLEDKLGMPYEPYIFSALHSARIMVVIGTSPENFQAVWVRNEWSRYLTLMKQGERKMLIPAFRDMDPYNLPTEFSHLQALDMSRLGFIQDLTYAVKKMLAEDTMIQPAAQVSTGWDTYGWKIGVALGCVFILALMLIECAGLYRSWERRLKENSQTVPQQLTEDIFLDFDTTEKVKHIQEQQTGEEAATTGILEEFLSLVYQCPADEISDSQLAMIQQLTIERDWEVWHFGYSFDAPGEDMILGFEEVGESYADSELIWVDLIWEDSVDLGGLSRFRGIKKLEVHYPLREGDLKGLQLESVCAQFDSPAEAAGMLDNPGIVKELGLDGMVDTLDGLEQFQNLETLCVDYFEMTNIDALIYAEHLKNLSINCDGNLTDFNVLGKLTNLEKLSLEAEGLKALDFLNALEKLDTLKISDAKIQTLTGLENCTGLKVLSVENCWQLRNLSAVSKLVNLQGLALHMPYGCSEPKLNLLTNVRKLSLNGQFEDFTFLQNMRELEELHLSGCDLEAGMDLSGLTSLKSLSCSYLQGFDWKVSAIEEYQMVERLDLHGTSTFDDISGIFNMPNLKELNISGMECEIDFDKIAENHTLEILHMDDVYLYENVEAYYDMGVTTAYMDNVALDEHTDFLRKFPELRELYVAENGLTDISFAETLSALEVLDISDNYVTQLRPLAGLPSLQKVICPGNPLGNEKVLKDSVLIITK